MSSFALNTTYKILYTFSVAVCFGFLTLNFNVAHAGLIFRAPSNLGLTQGLVGYWSFNGPDMSGNTAYDRSGNNNNGTLTNSPRRTSGRIGQALEFDGVDDSVEIGVASVLQPNTFSLSAWIKYDGSQANSTLVSWDVDGSQRPQFMIEAVGESSPLLDMDGNNFRWFSESNPTNLYDNQWHHWVVTMPGSAQTDINNSKLYVDGVEQDTSTTGSTVAQQAKVNFKIGETGADEKNTDAMIDEVRLYNRILSKDEIRRLYTMGR